MSGLRSEGVFAALHHDSASSNIDRFNKPFDTSGQTTFGFKGFPDNNMFQPKQPLRHQPSADVTSDVNRYFRKDTPPDWQQPPNQPPPRMPSPPPPPPQQPQKDPEWLQQKRSSPPPEAYNQTISPRYKDDQPSHRKPPVIFDRYGELSSADKRKKLDEIYIAEEDLAMARQRKEKEKMDKIREQQKIRELQDSYKPWGRPGGGAPNRIREMQEEFHPYGMPGGGAPLVKFLDEHYKPFGRPGGGAPVGDNRKMKFTEHQLTDNPEPKYQVPQGMYKPRGFSAMKYRDDGGGMDRVRTSMENNHMPERREEFGRAATMPMVRTSYSDSYRPKADVLRQQEREIGDLRRDINELERQYDYHHDHDRNCHDHREPRYEPTNSRMAGRNDKLNEMLQDQAKQMRHLEQEIERLRAQDDMSYRRDERPMYDNPRAQSDVCSSSIASLPLYVFTAKRNMLHKMNFVGMLFPKEPQTDRAGYRRHNRDNEIFGESVQKVPAYLNVSPRRHPVGRLYNKDSTYTTDFDVPFGKHGSRNLGNPNKEPMEPFSPYGLEGGGAPMVDASGQRKTRIAGSMGVLGRERSDSAKAGKAFKRDLLMELGEQAAFERARKEREKAYNRQGFVEVADSIRQKKVGYPQYNKNGLISEHHHLPHMFNTTPYAERMEQRKYHDYLERQIEDRNAMTRLGQFEEKRQAKEHYRTLDSFFGRRGGGNIKGPDPRKINLDRAIHNPQSTSQYYNKVRLDQEISPHEILDKFKPRITINSTHKNLYEYPQGDLKSTYRGRAPYAAEF